MDKELQDIQEMTEWLRKEIKDIDNSVKNKTIIIKDYTNAKLPTLATLLTFNEKEINKLSQDTKKRYEAFITNNKETISAITAMNLGAATISGIGLSSLAGAGGAIAGFGMAGFGVLGLGLLNPAFMVGAGVIMGKHLLKKKRLQKEYQMYKEIYQEMGKECELKTVDLREQFKENLKDMGMLFSSKAKKAMEVTKENSKKIAIQIDDAMNMDVNKRIMQYQEITLNQYKNQILLQENINDIIESYNNLVQENERLVSQIQEYEAKLNVIKMSEANFLNI